MKRKHEDDPSTLEACFTRMAHRRWLRDEFAGFPIELFEDCIMTQLAPVAADLLALAMTCKRLYHGPWRSTYGQTIEIGEHEEDSRAHFKGGKMFSQGALDLFAPYVKHLTYHLPCHHGWEPWKLQGLSVMEQCTFIGNECYSGTWESPLPKSLRCVVLKHYGIDSIHWHQALKGAVGQAVEVRGRRFDWSTGEFRPSIDEVCLIEENGSRSVKTTHKVLSSPIILLERHEE